MNMELTRDLLHELFEYRDGVLYWRERPSKCVDITKPAGYVGDRGYVRIGLKGKYYLAHRLIFLMHHGYAPKGVDHIDGNTSNNRIENLRPATVSQNQRNRGKQANNTSGYKGVCWHKARGKWVATITVNKGKVKHLGYYDTPEKAHESYCQAADEFHKDFANFG